MLSLAIAQVIITIFAVLFLLACIGEKQRDHKIIYSAAGLFLLVLLLVSIFIFKV